MSNERETQKEIRRIVRMLEATTKLLEKPHVEGLTDNLAHSEKRCIGQFNRALSRLYELEALPEGLFETLAEDATIGDIGYAYHQVATYLKEGIGFEFDFDFKKEKETIGNVMKDVGDVVARTIFSSREVDPEDGEAAESKIDTIEIVEVDDEAEKPDPIEPRLDKLEKQMETVVEILQEIRPKKNKKDKKDEKDE